ncbi:MAG: TRAP transporter fused permease subunit [Proteobacteria bacterium]|nr:TRAP transporter fused permease subunit [Pseudomonadota bacterium]
MRERWRGRVVAAVAISLSLFHLYAAAAAPFDPRTQRGVHLGAVLFLLYLLRPIFTGRLRPLNVVGSVLGAALCAYIVVDQDRIAFQAAIPAPWETPLGWIDFQTPMGAALIVLLVVGAWRTVGPALPLLAILSLAYAYFGKLIPGDWGHSGFGVPFIVGYSYLSMDAIFGLPIAVSATIIVMFTIFGSFLLRAGQGDFFSRLALRVAGRTRGGPAQVATISSALVGTISGSAVGNVACTGAFSIPLMKARGYHPAFAGAVEAAASTGGQIMPPVMGAGAFVMAEALGIPYLDIAIAAAIPAVLYFWNIMASVQFEAKRLGHVGLAAAELPPWRGVLSGLYLLSPIVVLVYFLNLGYSPMRASIWAILATVAISNLEALAGPFRRPGAGRRRALLAALAVAGFLATLPPVGPDAALRLALVVVAATALVHLFKLPTRIDIVALGRCLREGAEGVVDVATACAVAGIVIGVINLTGLGIKLTTLIVSTSQGVVFLALVLAAAASIILGMGLPTTVAYVIAGAVAAPALSDLGIKPLVAHLFVFYFACISVITPPVCLAAYVAAGMAGAHWFRTAVIACKLALPSFIVPFLFVYQPALLLDAGWPLVLWGFVSAMFGIVFLAASVIGHFLAPVPGWQRPVYFVTALLLIENTVWLDLAGAVLAAALVAQQLRKARVPAPAAA